MANTGYLRTPKLGETWVWMPCEKHAHKQLRDVVWVGRDFEDQPPGVQDDIMEHILCGCRYVADNPEAAIRELRVDEKRHEWEMRAKIASMLAGSGTSPEHSEASLGWLVPVILGVIAGLMYWFLHRGTP